MVTSINHLSREPLKEIFSHLGPEDLDNIKLVNKLFHETTVKNKAYIWKGIARTIGCPITTEQRGVDVFDRVKSFVSAIKQDLESISQDSFPECVKKILQNCSFPTLVEIRILQQFRQIADIEYIRTFVSTIKMENIRVNLSEYTPTMQAEQFIKSFTDWCECNKKRNSRNTNT